MLRDLTVVSNRNHEPSNLEVASNMEAVIQAHAAAEALTPVGTDEIVFRICEAIW